MFGDSEGDLQEKLSKMGDEEKEELKKVVEDVGLMEEIREEKIAQILSQLQSFIRGHMSRLTYKKLQSQKVSIMIIINFQYIYIDNCRVFNSANNKFIFIF